MQISRLHKAFANNSLSNINLTKTLLHKIGESGGFLGRILGALSKTGLSLMKSEFKPLAESILITLGLTKEASVTDAALHKKMFQAGYSSDLA